MCLLASDLARRMHKQNVDRYSAFQILTQNLFYNKFFYKSSIYVINFFNNLSILN